MAYKAYALRSGLTVISLPEELMIDKPEERLILPVLLFTVRLTTRDSRHNGNLILLHFRPLNSLSLPGLADCSPDVPVVQPFINHRLRVRTFLVVDHGKSFEEMIPDSKGERA